jgi:hypothetical protein
MTRLAAPPVRLLFLIGDTGTRPPAPAGTWPRSA